MKQPEFSQSEPPESTSTQQHKSLQQMRWKRSRKAQTIAWAIIVSVLPALAVGTVTYYLFNQSISKQNTLSKQIDTKAETKLTLQGQLSLLLIETGVTAVLAGTFAAILANRTIRPILNAADSNTVANRPSQEKGFIPDRIFGRDELAGLETNIGLEEQMPNLSWKRESADRFQVLLNIIRQIREAFSEEDVLRIAVEETRRAIGSDRVVIFRFDEAKSVALGVPRKRDVGSSQEGNFIAESAAPSWSKILWTTVHAPSFAREEVEQFHRGYPRAINDIYQAILTVPQIKFLEQLAVKACLVAPIFKNNQLFGLLIAHQCSGPRRWQQPEIDLLTQIAIQIGYALDHVWRLETINVKANYAQVFINVISSIRESISEEDILATTVEEVRKALRTDRVIVYGFDANWHGTVVAESVLPGWPKALWARIKDPCFEEGYIDKYQAGRVQATNNIYEAGLTDCHIGQLE
ncbi:MAG: GAF domain-containing protein, partial [Chroococcidiopsidaceae cyanobacterium CP_BM_ER_R8_30]|nr:GAF domain-containing protein [Chroococcidiopsidaceae cyanobacterium CP_BM_ER_R8_30]